ncbi:carotenoid ester lipase precursor [Coprinopsis sp. MPI-PUGE-AT-0042]|nr:carotenoid ester lipase precursor [Coprinopsis sp. MPI-PUGE-AT-0042]
MPALLPPMLPSLFLFGLAVQLGPVAVAATSQPHVEARAPVLPPTVTLGGGTFIGGSTNDGVHFFKGIPFAEPPVGPLRLNLPKPIGAYTGTHNATQSGRGCPGTTSIHFPALLLGPGALPREAQDMVKAVYPNLANSQDDSAPAEGGEPEDCLTIDVYKPDTATASSKLPVLVWIYGGGFQEGSAASYNGAVIVKRSLRLKEPVVFASMNYRLGGFGFLPGKQVRDAGVGNLGLQDQREALRWVQKHIAAFGGDPTKVTMSVFPFLSSCFFHLPTTLLYSWGQSAGSISVGSQMVANNGVHESLFRGAFLMSGAVAPTGPLENAQWTYDDVSRLAGCQGSQDSLECLRSVPFETLKKAIDTHSVKFTWSGTHLPWLPREDGKFFTANPMNLVQQGKIAKVPFVAGTVDDEGSIFSIPLLNLTTTAHVKQWIQNTFAPTASSASIDHVLSLYTADITQGSPYDTWILNALTPQFKRLASIQGDAVFEAPRRLFAQMTADKQDVYVYVYKRFKWIPIIASFHGIENMQTFSSGSDLANQVIFFTNRLDPNPLPGGGETPNWPKYTKDTKDVYVYTDNFFQPRVTGRDDYRQERIEALTQVLLETPV